MNEKEILKDLLVNESDSISNLGSIVKKTKEIFVIEDKTGNVIFKNYSKLKNHQKICAFLIGKYFAKRLSLIDSHIIKLSVIAEELGIPNTTLSKPLKQLKEKGLILKNNDNYRVNPHRIEEIVDNFFKLENKKK